MLVKRLGMILALLMVCENLCFTSISAVSAEKALNSGDLKSVISVASGDGFNIALKNDGTVWGWGLNDNGQLGRDDVTKSNETQKVGNLHDIEFIAAGKAHAAAIDIDGRVWCWGDNQYGQLGNGTNVDSISPVLVKTAEGEVLNNIVQVSCGDDFTVAVTANGNVYAWGSNVNGRLGNGTKQSSNYAILSEIQSVKKVKAGSKHALALTNSGEVYAWGNNSFGQLGDNTLVEKTTPNKVQNLDNVTDIAVGLHHNLILKSDSNIWGWGRNDNGQLGDGTSLMRVKNPKQLHTGTSIYAGSNNSFYADAQNDIWGMGYNYNGQLGCTNVYSPKVLQATQCDKKDVKMLAIGATHVLALDNYSIIWGWGDNTNNQLDGQSEKTGLPRKLKIKLNDVVGDTVETAKNFTGISESFKSAFEGSNDVDYYSIEPQLNGILNLRIDFTSNNHYVTVYEDNSIIYNSTDKYINTDLEVKTISKYYIKLHTNNIGDYTLDYKIYEQNKTLTAKVEANGTNFSVIGKTNAGEEKDIIIRLYDPNNKLTNIYSIISGENGLFKKILTVDANLEGTYQVLVSGKDTMNVVYDKFDVVQASEVRAIRPRRSAEGELSIETIKFNTDFTVVTRVNNLSSETIGASLTLIAKDKNDNLISLMTQSASIPSGIEQLLQLFYNKDEYNPEYSYYAYVCKGISSYSDEFIPVFDKAEGSFVAKNDMLRSAIDPKYQADWVTDEMLEMLNKQMELENASKKVMRSAKGTVDGVITDIPTTPYANYFTMYDDEFYEGTIRDGCLYLEVNVINPTNKVSNLDLFVTSQDEEGRTIMAHKLSGGKIQPFSTEMFGYNIMISDYDIKPVNTFKIMMWGAPLQPLSNSVTLTREVASDAFFSDKTINAFNMLPGTAVNGKINGVDDRDLIQFIADDSRTIEVYTEPRIEEETGLNLKIRNSRFEQINEEGQVTVDVEAGNVYYLDITGLDGTEYYLNVL